jgi:hypothetical protein
MLDMPLFPAAEKAAAECRHQPRGFPHRRVQAISGGDLEAAERLVR